jgi:ABC-type transport system involved in multi-copper enzyme maturation permease subunit
LPLRKRPFWWLVEKELRDLAASRSWWVLLVAMGPLVGISFISAVQTYGEVSGLNGTSAGVGEALSPLIGVWGPTFSSCELAAVFLLPFVIIRLVGGDRQNGALKLELQQGASTATLVAAKVLVAVFGWIVAMLPALSAILLWKSYGGSVYWPEIGAVAAGHLLNAGLTIALAAAMASVAEHPSTAAILTLGVTVGTWIINFFGAIQGGIWETAAGYTPAALVAEFQHGLIRLDVLLIAVTLVLLGLSLSAVWMRLGEAAARRAARSAGLVGLAAALILGCTQLRGSWDLSESRGNSFPEADEQALRQIRQPLSIEVHLAAEDPRRLDLERRALSKLRRTMSNLRVTYVSATSIGMFEQTASGYGEIRYSMGNRREMSRVTTEEGVLEAIYSVAQIPPPKEDDEAVYRGHPLAARPTGAGAVFFWIWPAAFALAAAIRRVVSNRTLPRGTAWGKHAGAP